MQHWVIFTPQLKACIILISSPLTMSLALWGMTSHRDMQLMKNRTPSVYIARASFPLFPPPATTQTRRIKALAVLQCRQQLLQPRPQSTWGHGTPSDAPNKTLKRSQSALTISAHRRIYSGEYRAARAHHLRSHTTATGSACSGDSATSS